MNTEQIGVDKLELLVWWIGPEPMPPDRRENVNKFLCLHPEALVYEKYIQSDLSVCDRKIASDRARRMFCSGGKRRLWVDNDIEPLCRFSLGKKAAVAMEAFPHWSICWSGEYPELFDIEITDIGFLWNGFVLEGRATYIYADRFIHWNMIDGIKTIKSWRNISLKNVRGFEDEGVK